MSNPFKQASKDSGAFARICLMGSAGSGKTYSALTIASNFGSVAFGDTEYGSARKYSDKFQFDVAELNGDYSSANLIQLVDGAVANNYGCLVIDSFSHFWDGDKGILEVADNASEKMGGNTARGWAVATPQWRKQIQKLMSAPIHLIVCLRTKNNFEMIQDANGKMRVQVIGTKPIQREDMVYEFDVIGRMRPEAGNSVVSIEKTRCPELHSKEFTNLTATDFQPYFQWLGLYNNQ